MGVVKETHDFWNSLPKNSVLKWLLYTILILIVLFLAAVIYRLVSGDKVTAWGLNISSKDTIYKEKPAVLQKNTVSPSSKADSQINRASTYQNTKPSLIKNRQNTVKRKSIPPVNPFKDSSKSKLNVEFKAPVTNSPMQFGDNNVQNNQFGSKPREVADELLNFIKSKVPDLNSPISIARRSQDAESYQFAAKIVKALNAIGYKNAFVNGITNDAHIGGDPSAEAKRQASITCGWSDGQFELIVPSNQ